MSNITMTITAASPEELFSTIRGCAALIDDDVPTASPEDVPAPDYSKYAQSTNAPTSSATPAPATPADTALAPAIPAASAPPVHIPSAAPTAAPTTSAVPTAPAPAYTLDQINRAGADLITARPDVMPQITALMGELGVQSLSELNPSMYGAVAQRLRELGAKL